MADSRDLAKDQRVTSSLCATGVRSFGNNASRTCLSGLDAGFIPPALGLLGALRELNLSRNQLSGEWAATTTPLQHCFVLSVVARIYTSQRGYLVPCI